ncbi:hypothetical protein [Streptomyces sp. TRM70350]|uniref:hypothetical protein n=1 Tax=Streptomyces sp. TRM70350 TaxID=2856165 RepID=UPI001C486DCF|nr:hypothetical protein [Streptomyces sp. TRM70350]MBV7695660.1 hypothetical protein [Streptomyces sp. TRM70350]
MRKGIRQGEGGLQQLLDMTGYLAVEMQRNTLLRAGVRLAVEQGLVGKQEYSIYEWWADRFHQDLVVARQKGQLIDGVDEAAFAQLLVAAYTGTQVMCQLSTGRADLPRRITDMWRCLLPALAPADVISGLRIPAADPDGVG